MKHTLVWRSWFLVNIFCEKVQTSVILMNDVRH